MCASQKTYNERISDREKWYLEERILRKYYQKTLFKLARDLKLFEDEAEEKKEKFEQVFEDEDDLNYQR